MFVFPSHCKVMGPALLEVAEHLCPTMGIRALIPCLALPVCVAFAFPVELSLPQPVNFYPSVLSPASLAEE